MEENSISHRTRASSSASLNSQKSQQTSVSLQNGTDSTHTSASVPSLQESVKTVEPEENLEATSHLPPMESCKIQKFEVHITVQFPLFVLRNWHYNQQHVTNKILQGWGIHISNSLINIYFSLSSLHLLIDRSNVYKIHCINVYKIHSHTHTKTNTWSCPKLSPFTPLY